MYFSVRLAGSEMWCSKDLGWIVGALQKEHQRALDQRRLADYTREGVEAKVTVKVDFILPQGEKKTVTAATPSVENTSYSPPEATIRFIQKSTSKQDLNKAHQAILDSTLALYNSKFRDAYDREEEPEYWQRVSKAVQKLMAKGKVPAEASQVEQDDVIDLSLPGLDDEEGEDSDLTPEPADNVLQTPHQQRPGITGSAQQQVMLAAMAEPDLATKPRKEKKAKTAAAAAAANADADAEMEPAKAEGPKAQPASKKRRLVKAKELNGQARATRANTSSQAAAESSIADD
ncbi:hypothetical protein COCSUDRAFT_55331 [Coccomyxa subellipsoidea C-169]|uniref:Uncharacterized protein n=1 Tax=Coccomyxa subellipsoidea (strain C-169) TaxID=574566 RepID=I0YZ43_COCSC|nr:hypothetical protein COCSUDRAFT_63186 [Coccomyxa subellipsoidea C-169]XP_005651856.1 hypothetical protein COCSUDRAFT_55331 [Coccomyxa subellipsoidea C-169]EIE23662.1 hypothetical protein COCSUDRAFT_63186 [Coccomyxa subellipsoidea C-169]EIE27312.1 hypothetical protein COCSUDRAFT_55331 [Coccomyxa subellipsoidea C-169]|eukprot:XP_005648206.1 hypothetical protein COCSUDRAFT_63186 [Coccomyxa subellipsoidea C-169]